MFFKSRKQAKINEENRKKELQLLEEQKAKKEREYHVEFNENERIRSILKFKKTATT